MKVAIATSKDGSQIATVRDYDGIIEKGQISHFITELESIKVDLVRLWEEYEDE